MDPVVADVKRLAGEAIEGFRGEVAEDNCADQLVKVSGVDGLDRALPVAVLDRLLAHVVADKALLAGLPRPVDRAGTHRGIIASSKLPLEKVGPGPSMPGLAVLLLHEILDSVPKFLIDDGIMKTRPALPLAAFRVRDPPQVEWTGEDTMEVLVRQPACSVISSGLAAVPLRRMPSRMEAVSEADEGGRFQVAGKDFLDELGLLRNHIKLPLLTLDWKPVAKGRLSRNPHAFLSRSGQLVADSLPGDVPLELREGEEHVEGESPHGVRGVELLGHRNERDPVPLEPLHHLSEVSERTGEAIDLIHDHDIHTARLDVREEPLQRRPLKVCPRKSSIVVPSPDDGPALMLLALDVVERRLALSIERVEGLLESFSVGLPRVDRTADYLPAHDTPRTLCSPKNRGPDQWAEVIFSAIFVRLLKDSPRY